MAHALSDLVKCNINDTSYCYTNRLIKQYFQKHLVTFSPIDQSTRCILKSLMRIAKNLMTLIQSNCILKPKLNTKCLKLAPFSITVSHTYS